MPLDTRIIGSGQQQPFNNPFQALAAGRQAQAAQQAQQQAQQEQSALRGQQFQQNAQALQAGHVEADELAAYKASIGNPDLTPESLLEEIRVKAPGKFEAARGRYEAHQQNILQTKQLKQQLQTSTKAWIGGHLEDIANSDYSPLVAEATLKMIEAEEPQFAEQAAQIRQQLLEGGKPALKALVDKMRPPVSAKAAGDLAHQTAQTAKLTRETELLGQPKPATNFEDAIFAATQAKDFGRVRELMVQRGQMKAQDRAPAAPAEIGPLETIIGPDGKPIRVERKDAVGKAPGAGTEKASSGVQKKALAFFNRAQQADVDLEGLEDSYVSKLSGAGQARLAMAPNFAQTEEGQRYNQAQRAFTEARLRKDSGAAIPAHEFESDRQTYFVQPLDKPATVAQKRRARGAMLASLGFESGQALGEFMGDADEAAAVIEKYKARSAAGQKTAAPAAGAGKGPAIGSTVTFNGKKYKVAGITNGQADLEPL